MATVDPIAAGRRLRELRENMLITPDLRTFIRDPRNFGITLEEAALLTKGELSKATISKLERGEVTSPSLQSMAILGRIYHMTPNDMAEIFGFYEPVVRDLEDDHRVQEFLRTVRHYQGKDPNKSELLLNGLSGLMRMVEGFQN